VPCYKQILIIISFMLTNHRRNTQSSNHSQCGENE
jgi:hypothetical protein